MGRRESHPLALLEPCVTLLRLHGSFTTIEAGAEFQQCVDKRIGLDKAARCCIPSHGGKEAA